MTLEELTQKLAGNGSYTPKTDDEIEAAAKRRYSTVYNQKKQTAQNQYDASDLALQQQLNSLQATYDKQRENTAEQYESAMRSADRAQIARGMQRSSYNQANLMNIGLKGMKAIGEIDDAQNTAAGNIEAQRAQLAQQLAGTLAGYETDQLNDELAYRDELQDREYDRGINAQNTANTLAMNLYEYYNQAEQQKQSQENWQKEFDQKYKKKGRGGGKKAAADGENADANANGFSDASSALLAALANPPAKETPAVKKSNVSYSGGGNISANKTYATKITK